MVEKGEEIHEWILGGGGIEGDRVLVAWQGCARVKGAPIGEDI